MTPRFTHLINGIGLGYRPAHYEWVNTHRPQVDWFEIVSENFLGGGRSRAHLEKLRENYPVAMHGVSLSIASYPFERRDYLKRIRALADWLDPFIVSDHLCWTRLNAHQSHDLLPISYTAESLAHLEENVSLTQELLGRKIFLENTSAYVEFANNEMTEHEFFNQLCRTTGCGILLDLNNIIVNWKNLGWNPIEYLEGLPKEAIGQFHLAGHTVSSDVRIDTHDAPVSQDVWNLYSIATKRWPTVPTLIEWDDQLPEFSRLIEEVELARSWKNTPITQMTSEPFLNTPPPKSRKTQPISAETAREYFFYMATSPQVATDAIGLHVLRQDRPVIAHRGISVYSNAYFHRILDAMKDTFPTLAFVMQDEGFRFAVSHYLLSHPPSKDSIKYVGEVFGDFLRNHTLEYDFGVAPSALADLAAFDWQRYDLFDADDQRTSLSVEDLQRISPENWETIRFKISQATGILKTTWDILPVVEKVEKKEIPDKPVARESSFLFYRTENQVRYERITSEDLLLWTGMKSGKSFKECCETSDPTHAAHTLTRWVQQGLIENSF